MIMGIDPGTLVTGYGIIKVKEGQFEVVDFGCIKPPASYQLSERYLVIFNSIDQLITQFQPDAIAVETQYVRKNVQSAIKLGMARGTVIIAAARRKIPIHEYAPTKAKLAVVGKGSASKFQVQCMVQHLLNLNELPEPEDAADALALAICHANTLNQTRRCDRV